MIQIQPGAYLMWNGNAASVLEWRDLPEHPAGGHWVGYANGTSLNSWDVLGRDCDGYRPWNLTVLSCEMCESWLATQTINGFQVCDKPKCQDAAARKDELDSETKKLIDETIAAIEESVLFTVAPFERTTMQERLSALVRSVRLKDSLERIPEEQYE